MILTLNSCLPRPDRSPRRVTTPLFVVATVLATTSMCSVARAVPLENVTIGASLLNVESVAFVGDGSEVSYIVVDFRAAGGGSFAFEYRHNGRDTAEQMLAAFDREGVLLHFLEDFSFGPAVRGIAYRHEEQEAVFPSAFGGPLSWILWDGLYENSRVEWTSAQVGINGVEFGETEPTVFLPGGGFYGLAVASGFPGEAPLVPLPGDFDSNGVVDGDDLLSLLLGFGTGSGPTLASGDADRDGDVDRADHLLWSQHLEAQVPPAVVSVAIPEPPSRLIACVAILLVGGGIARRSSKTLWNAKDVIQGRASRARDPIGFVPQERG